MGDVMERIDAERKLRALLRTALGGTEAERADVHTCVWTLAYEFAAAVSSAAQAGYLPVERVAAQFAVPPGAPTDPEALLELILRDAAANAIASDAVTNEAQALLVALAARLGDPELAGSGGRLALYLVVALARTKEEPAQRAAMLSRMTALLRSDPLAPHTEVKP